MSGPSYSSVVLPAYNEAGSIRDTLLAMRTYLDDQGYEYEVIVAADALFPCMRIDGYMCDIELLYLAERLRLRVKEVGIRWRDDGDSRLDLVRGNLQNSLDLLRIRFGRYPLT